MYNPKTMNAIFDSMLSNYNLKTQAVAVHPKTNVSETEEGFNLEILVPGIEKNEIKISVDKGILTISYEAPKKEDEKKMLRHEFKTASFRRSYYLDEKINADAIAAKYENGILYLTLPKKEEVKEAAKEITIQ